MRQDLAVIGGGHAAGRLAAALLELGYPGRIAIYGEEGLHPYERPPLSKRDLLRDDAKFGSAVLKDMHLSDPRLTLRLGSRVEEVDLARATLRLQDGAQAGFDRCVFATGVSPRMLVLPPWLPPTDACYLRSAADAAALRSRLEAANRICVIGGGFIGLEVASSARARGCAVTLLERAERLIPRLLSPAASHELHRRLIASEAIDVRFCSSLPDHGRRTEAGYHFALEDTAPVFADLFVIGIGSVPNDRLARDAGLDCADGILVDGMLRASREGYYAIGDVARVASSGTSRRIESWDNAQRQALALAHYLMDREYREDAPDWFWSDIGDTNLQLIGTVDPRSEPVVRKPDAERLSLYHLAEDRLIGAELFNMGGDRRPIERLIQSGTRIDRHQLADPDVRLRVLVN